MFTKFTTYSSIILVVVAIIFGTFQPLVVQAQNASVNCTGSNSANCIPSGAGTTAGASTGSSASSALNCNGTNSATCLNGGETTVPTAANTPAIAAATPTAGTPSSKNPVDNTSNIGCNLSTAITSGFGGAFALCLTNVVYIFTVGIGSGFAYVSAYFFDYAISLSLNSAAYGLGFVSQGWTTARDVANMAFLFVLIYIAFLIMFEAETSGTIPLLTAVIVMALIVNFSFFFTRLAIDAGNILSIQFYNAITAPSIASSAQNTGVAAASIVNTANNALGSASLGNSKDLTASIMGMLQLQNLFSNPSFNAFFSTSPGFMVTTIALSFLYIAAAIMFWLLTVMFATAGMKFLFRIVALWFLIIASPLAFVAYAIPGLRQYFKQWLSLLIENSFYPAAFMFIFLILTNFSNQMSGNNGIISGIFTGLTPGTNTASGAVAQIGYAAANVGIRMGFVIAILWVGLEASKRLGVMGGEAANKFGSWVGTGVLKGYNVPYKYVGPGALAGLADRGLQKTKFGNSLLGYELRRYVTKPLAGTTIPGSHGESYTQLIERQRKESSEKKANLRDIETKKIIQPLPDVEKSLQPLAEKAELKKLNEQEELKRLHAAEVAHAAGTGPALTRAESDRKTYLESKGLSDISASQDARRLALVGRGVTPITATEEDKKKTLDAKKSNIDTRLKSLSEREIGEIGAKNIKPYVHAFSENQIKTMKNIKTFTDAQKEDLEMTWQEKGAAAPLKKADDITDKLAQIDTDLRVVGKGLKPGGGDLKGVEIMQLNTANTTKSSVTKSGDLITKDKLEAALKSIGNETERVRGERDSLGRGVGTAPARTFYGQQLKDLQDAKKQVEDLKDKMKEISPKVSRASEGAGTLTVRDR